MTGLFEWIGRNISRFLMAAAFVISVIIARAIMAQRFGWLPNYLCDIGLAEAAGARCVETRIDAIRREMDAERKRLEAERRTLEARMADERGRLNAEIAEIETARVEAEAIILDVEPVITQASAPTGLNGYVAVSASYRTGGGAAELLGAVCYLAEDTGGPDPRTPLARMRADRSVTPAGDGGVLSASDAERARAACPWPQA